MNSKKQDLEEYKYFFDETPVALIRTDIETGEFIMANKQTAHLLGYKTVEDLLSYGNAKDLYESEQERKKLLKELRKHGSVQNYEMKFILPSGEVIWAAANLRINCGNSCIEGCLVDITEFKDAEKTEYVRQLKRLSTISEKIDQALRVTA